VLRDPRYRSRTRIPELDHAVRAGEDDSVADMFEREANNFARYALFQGDAFARAAADCTLEIKTPMRLAKKFGATHTVDARTQDVVESIGELTGGHGADVVIDAVGRPETFRQAFYARDLARVFKVAEELEEEIIRRLA
jgi:hypothetical protein